MKGIGKKLIAIYNSLLKHFGHQDWWPGETPFEVMVGAILTQNTAWNNVEKAILNLKREGALDYEGLRDIALERLTLLIKPSGYYNQKAKKLKNLIAFLDGNFSGNLKEAKKVRMEKLREMLLGVNGIGLETADSILLYAFGKKTFVVDAYTRRIFSRVGLVTTGHDYEAIRALFMENIPGRAGLYNDYHAQIVALGKNICRKRPNCLVCPISHLCGFNVEKLKGVNNPLAY